MIKKHIISDPQLNKIFSHPKQKYILDDLIMNVIIILYKGHPSAAEVVPIAIYLILHQLIGIQYINLI